MKRGKEDDREGRGKEDEGDSGGGKGYRREGRVESE